MKHLLTEWISWLDENSSSELPQCSYMCCGYLTYLIFHPFHPSSINIDQRVLSTINCAKMKGLVGRWPTEGVGQMLWEPRPKSMANLASGMSWKALQRQWQLGWALKDEDCLPGKWGGRIPDREHDPVRGMSMDGRKSKSSWGGKCIEKEWSRMKWNTGFDSSVQ